MMDRKRKLAFLLMRAAHPAGRKEAQLKLCREIADERLDIYIDGFAETIKKKKVKTEVGSQ